MNFIRLNTVAVSAFLIFSANMSAIAHEYAQTSHEQSSAITLQVKGQLPPLTTGITDLKFNELYKMPVGPRGMEPSKKLLSLDNKHVRIVGYMAKQETPTSGMFIISPLPVNMGDEDDKFADDMPANSIYVHLDNPDVLVNYIPGLIHLTGVLSVGNATETDDRVSYVRLKLDNELSVLFTPRHQASN